MDDVIKELTWLLQRTFEKKWGFHPFTWEYDVTLDAGETIRIDIEIPNDEVWFVAGCNFGVDELGVIKVTFIVDGIPFYQDITVDGGFLEVSFVQPLIAENNAVFIVKNTDSVNSHRLKKYGKLYAFPRQIYDSLYGGII